MGTPPSDFIHCLLCLHTYETNVQPGERVQLTFNDENLESYNEYLTNWKVKEVFDFDNFEPFYAILYENEKDRQLVFAHRGLLIKHFSYFNSSYRHYKKVCNRMSQLINDRVNTNHYEKTIKVLTEACNQQFFLSFTGYNFGGFLAQLCLCYCYKKKDSHSFLSKAVLFNPIGAAKSCKELTAKMDTDCSLHKEVLWATVCYLTRPSLLNTCIRHEAGSIYKLNPPIPTLDSFLMSFGERAFCSSDCMITNDIFSLSKLSLQLILKEFNVVSMSPGNFKIVTDWPVLQSSGWIREEEDYLVLLRTLNLLCKNQITEVDMEAFQPEYYSRDFGVQFELLFLQGLTYEQDNMSYAIYFQQTFEGKEGNPRKCPMTKKYSCFEELQLLQECSETLSRVQEKFTIVYEDDGEFVVINESCSTTVDELYNEVKSFMVTHRSNRMTISQTKKEMELNFPCNLPNSNENRPTETNRNEQKMDLIEDLKMGFQQHQKIAICGFCGTGKTRLAKEFSIQMKQEQNVIVKWFNEETKYQIMKDYPSIFEEMHENHYSYQMKPCSSSSSFTDKHTSAASRQMHELIENTNWKIYFVIDNVSDFKEIATFKINLPSHFRLLITTRRSDVPNGWKQIKLQPFTENEAYYYLNSHLSSQNLLSNLMDIFKRRGGFLPKALQSAVVAFNESSILTLEEYKTKKMTKYNDESNILINQLENDPLAWKILQFLTFLNMQFVEADFIKRLIDQGHVSISINYLKNLSLIKIANENCDDTSIEMDPMVRSTVSDYIESGGENSLTNIEMMNCIICSLEFPMVNSSPDESWLIAHRLLPYINAIKDRLTNDLISDVSDEAKYKLLSLYLNVSLYLFYYSGEIKEALFFANNRLSLLENYFADKRGDIAWTRVNIAMAYRKLQQPEKAIKLLKEAVKTYNESESMDSKILAYISKLKAECYDDLGNLEKALKFIDLSNQIRKEKFPDFFEGRALCWNCKGRIYHHMENYEKAMKYYNKGLQTKNQYVESIQCCFLNDFGLCSGDNNDLDQSLNALLKCHEIWKKFQKAPVYTALCLNDIGVCYYSNKLYQDALQSFEESLQGLIDKYGNEHLLIARCYNNIGFCYYGLKNIEKALEFHEKALEMRQKLLNKNDWSTAGSLQSIGLCYLVQNNKEKAKEFLDKSFSMRQELFEYRHKHGEMCMRCKGECSYTNDELSFIRVFLQELHDMNKQINSDDGVLQSLNHIAFCERDMGNYPTALHFYNQAQTFAKGQNCLEQNSLGNILFNAGLMSLRMAKFKKSSQYFKEAERHFSNFPIDSLSRAAVRRNINVVKSNSSILHAPNRFKLFSRYLCSH